jgi:hypothetical protein
LLRRIPKVRFVALLLLIGSCAAGEPEGGDAGVQGARLQLTFDPAGGTHPVVAERAVATLEEIRFAGDSGEDLETEGVSLDLLGTPPPVVVDNAAPGLYSRVRLRLGKGDGETLSIDGSFEGTPLQFRARDEDEIDLRCPSGRPLDPGGEVRFVVDIDRSRWFQGVELHEAEAEGGIVRLDPDEEPNRELAEEVFENIKASFSIHDAPGRGGEPDGHPEDDGGPDDGGGD